MSVHSQLVGGERTPGGFALTPDPYALNRRSTSYAVGNMNDNLNSSIFVPSDSNFGG